MTQQEKKRVNDLAMIDERIPRANQRACNLDDQHIGQLFSKNSLKFMILIDQSFLSFHR